MRPPLLSVTLAREREPEERMASEMDRMIAGELYLAFASDDPHVPQSIVDALPAALCRRTTTTASISRVRTAAA